MKKEFKIKRFVKAMMITGILIALALVVNNLYAQKKNKEGNPKSIVNQPQVNIKVDKQTDKNGNITRYDSTYSWSWSGNGQMPENVDSLMKCMHDRFGKGFSFNGRNPGFHSDLFNDSAFFSDNFEGMFGKDFGNMDKMFAEQEKMMKKYFDQEPVLKVPNGVTPQPPKIQEKKQKQQTHPLRKQQPLIEDNSYTTQL